MAIADELPIQTLALRERAAEIYTRIAAALAESAKDDANLLPLLATALSKRREQAERSRPARGGAGGGAEAAELSRALAAQRPDAFRPNLAMSLNNLANRLSDLGGARRRWRRRARRWTSVARWRRSGPTRSGPIWRCR